MLISGYHLQLTIILIHSLQCHFVVFTIALLHSHTEIDLIDTMMHLCTIIKEGNFIWNFVWNNFSEPDLQLTTTSFLSEWSLTVVCVHRRFAYTCTHVHMYTNWMQPRYVQKPYICTHLHSVKSTLRKIKTCAIIFLN